MQFPKALWGPLAVLGIVIPVAVSAAESHLDYAKREIGTCTKRALTAAEQAYFAHYGILREALPPTPPGWQAKDYSWTPPDRECVQKDTSDYILAVDVNYTRPLSKAKQAKLKASYTAKSPQAAELESIDAKKKALYAKVTAIRKANRPLAAKVSKEHTKVLLTQSKLSMAMISGDRQKAQKLQAAYDAQKAKYQPLKAKLDRAQAPLDKLQQQQSKLDKRGELLLNQDRVASQSSRFDLKQDHSARVYIQLDVSENNPIRMMNTPLNPEAMNATDLLCIGPEKLEVAGALYAWRCSNEDEYNTVAEWALAAAP